MKSLVDSIPEIAEFLRGTELGMELAIFQRDPSRAWPRAADGSPLPPEDYLRELIAMGRRRKRFGWRDLVERRTDLQRAMRHGRSGRPGGGPPGYVADSARGAQYLVPHLVTAGLSSWYGPQQHGKTSTVCAAVAAWAFGLPFAGYAPSVPLNVLWASYEDSAGTSEHLSQFVGAWDHPQHPSIWVTGKLPPLTPVYDEVPQTPWLRSDLLYNWLPWRPDLIVVDSYSAMLAANGADEVVGAPKVIEALRDACSDLGCGILLIAHSKKGEAAVERGSALRDACDVMVPVACDERSSDGRATFRWQLSAPESKWRHGPRPARDVLLDFAPTDHGWRCIGHRVAEPGFGKSTKSKRPKAIDRVLAALTSEGQRLDDIRAAAADDSGPMPASSTSRALAALVEAGKAQLEQKGPAKLWRLA